MIPYNTRPCQVFWKMFFGHGRGRARPGSGRGVSSSPAVRAGWPGRGACAPVAAGVLTRAGGRWCRCACGRAGGWSRAGVGVGVGEGLGLGACCWGVGVRCAVSCACGRVGVWCFWVRLVMRGVPCGVMGWLVWSWLFGVVWFTLPTKLAMQKHPISMLYLCWLANPLAGRNRLSGAGHWTLGFPSFPRRPLI